MLGKIFSTPAYLFVKHYAAVSLDFQSIYGSDQVSHIA